MSLTSLRTNPIVVDAALAGALAALAAWVGPDGTDYPAHLYQLDLYRSHGFELWSTTWYGGRSMLVGYSLLYYPLADLLGLKALAVISAAAAAGAFTALTTGVFGDRARWAGRMFALASAAAVVTAAFPYALGLALALGALAAVARTRLGWFALLTLLAYGASPLAFLFEVVALAAAAPSRPWRVLARPAVVVAIVGTAAIVCARLVPDLGRYPFASGELAATLGFCLAGAALTWRVERGRMVSMFFAVYAGVCVLAYAVGSDLGGNVARLRLVAVPITVLVLALRRWRPLPLALLTLALAIAWNGSPLVYDLSRSTGDPSATRAYWEPAIRFLQRSLTPSYRVEVVATADHWEAVYLPKAGIPIARGWFRQDDFPENAILYGRLTRSAYLDWLRRLGVGYVVLTTASLDYSSRAEAALVRSGGAGLQPVFGNGHLTVYAVPHPWAIVTGPGSPRVIADYAESLQLLLSRPGSYQLAIRFSPYLRAPDACLNRERDGLVQLVAKRAGSIRLGFSLSGAGALAALTGAATVCTGDG